MGKQRPPRRTPYWYDAPSVSDLVRELVCLRDVGIVASGTTRTDEMPQIVAKAKKRYPTVGLVQIALERLMTAAIGQMVDPLYREAARWEFGLEGRALDSGQRREHIRTEIFDVSERTFRRPDRIERKILDLTEAGLNALDTGTEKLVSPPRPFVARPDIYAALDTILRAPHAGRAGQQREPVYIFGEPGTGKSRVAREYFSGEDTVVLQANSADALSLSISRVLAERAPEVHVARSLDLRHELARLAARDVGSPDVIILDGHKSPGEVNQLFPRGTKSLIVVTTTATPPVGAKVVTVEELSVSESVELVVKLHPELPDGSPLLLADVFGGRARALVQATSLLIQYPDIDVVDFCHSARGDIAIALDAGSPVGETSLAQIYREMNLRIGTAGYTAEILDFLAFAGHSNLTEVCVLVYLLGGPGYYASSTRTRARVRYVASLRPLLELGLIHTDGDRVYLDELTAMMMRGLRTTRRADVVRKILMYATSSDDGRPAWEPWDLISQGWKCEDVAAYFTAHAAAMWRIDIKNALDGTQEERADLGGALEELFETTWESIYAVSYKGIEAYGSTFAELWGAIATRRTRHDLIEAWLEVSNGIAAGLAEPEPPPAELIELIYGEPPSVEQINEWRESLGMSRLAATKNADTWGRAYALYQIIQTVRAIRDPPELRGMNPGRGLALMCHRVVKDMGKIDALRQERGPGRTAPRSSRRRRP